MGSGAPVMLPGDDQVPSPITDRRRLGAPTAGDLPVGDWRALRRRSADHRPGKTPVETDRGSPESHLGRGRARHPRPTLPPAHRAPARAAVGRRLVQVRRVVAEREELTETGLGSTARCRGRRRHRQANSVRVCAPTSRRVASLRPRSAGLTALTPAPRTLVQTGSCRRCSLIHPLHVVVDVPSRMTLFRATADSVHVREQGLADLPNDTGPRG